MFAGACRWPFLSRMNPVRTIQPNLTLILLTWRIWWAAINASKWQMGFNVAFEGLRSIFRRARKIAKSEYLLRHVCLRVRPSAWSDSAHHSTVFHEIWSQHFSKIWWESSSSIKIGQELQVLYIKTDTHFWYPAEFFLEWETFQTKAVLKIKKHILCLVTFYRKPLWKVLWDNVEKYWTDNVTHAHCMLGN